MDCDGSIAREDAAGDLGPSNLERYLPAGVPVPRSGVR
jgi:hypothetical protein